MLLRAQITTLEECVVNQQKRDKTIDHFFPFFINFFLLAKT